MKLDDPKPEQKNYLDENADVVMRLYALHDKWDKNVKPK